MFAKPKYIPDTTVAERYAGQAPSRHLWLRQRQDAAIAAFKAGGYPTRTVEAWKFTDVKSLLALKPVEARPHQGDISAAAKYLDALPAGPRIVFVNGAFHTALSESPQWAGITVQPVAKLLAEQPQRLEPYLGALVAPHNDHAFNQLSLAFAQDGLAVLAEDGCNAELPLVVAHIFTGGAQAASVAMRHVVVLGANSCLTLVEHTLGVPDAVYTGNSVTEIFLAGNAALRHVLVQRESAAAAQVQTRYVQQSQESRYHSVALTTGAKINRVETQITLQGEGADATMHTVQLLRGHLHSDSMTHVLHDTVNATSNQHCRMILDDQAKGAFQGKTIVARDAQKTDAHQLNKNLLLSRQAVVDSKPELEIYADDVACSHGATTGELDAMALFYLQSRGIEKATARQLLVEAFADDVIDETLLDDEWKEVLRARVSEWMQAGGRHG